MPDGYRDKTRTNIYVHNHVLRCFIYTFQPPHMFRKNTPVILRAQQAASVAPVPMCSSFLLSAPSAKRHKCRRHPPSKRSLKLILKNIDTHNWDSYRAFQHQLWRSRAFLMKQLRGFDRYLLYKSNKRHLRAARAEPRSDSKAGRGNRQQTLPVLSNPKNHH